MLYRYVYSRRTKTKAAFRVLSRSVFWLGVVVIAAAAAPIVGWHAINYFVSPNMLYPLALGRVAPSVLASQGENYTNPQSWFTGFSYAAPAEPKSYFLTIKKLGIQRAEVVTGGSDLSRSLIAWPSGGSAGQPGTAVVFGHSALPIFYNPQNYTTIFTHLLSLESGDEIEIDNDGAVYRYVVEGKRVVGADDLSILEQRFDLSRLTLITCVPPGTYLKRGVITARLQAL